jgi:hypothetical protein
MSWVRVDDAFHRNAKQLRMSDAAFRVYVCSMSFCAVAPEPTGYMTDEQAAALIRSLGKQRKVAAELVSLNAWERVADGYLLHDFDEYLERGSRDRVRKWREKMRAGDASVTLPGRHDTPGGDVTETFLARDGDPVPVPEPDPVPSPRLISTATIGSQDPRVLELVKGWEEVAGRVASSKDLQDAAGLLAEFQRVEPAAAVQQIREYAAWRRDHDPPLVPLRSLVLYRDQLRRLNEHLAEQQVPPRDAIATRGADHGLQRVRST